MERRRGIVSKEDKGCVDCGEVRGVVKISYEVQEGVEQVRER